MNPIKYSFELLLARQAQDVFQKDSLSEIELPPLYKTFIQSFNVGRDRLKFEYFISSKSGKKLELGDLNYKGSHSEFIGLYNLFSLEEADKVYLKLYAKDQKIRNHQLYPIGECISNNMLMLGCGQENLDQIFLENPNLFEGNKRILFVDSNIFEFIKKLELIESERIGYGVKNHNQLYKRWGETSWRVNQEEETTNDNSNVIAGSFLSKEIKKTFKVIDKAKNKTDIKLSKLPKVKFTLQSFRRNNVGVKEAYVKNISYHESYEIVGNNKYKLLFNCACGTEINMNHNHDKQGKLISHGNSDTKQLYVIGQQLGLVNLGRENDDQNFKYVFKQETAFFKTNICPSCQREYLKCFSMSIGDNRPGSCDLINFHGIYLVNKNQQ